MPQATLPAMTTPITNIYVRPGWTSPSWSYGGTSVGASGVVAVAFDLDSTLGQQVGRGVFQYSVDGGSSWTSYALAADGQGSYVSAAGTVWRFVDQQSGDTVSPGSFTAHWKLADNSVVSTGAAVVVDNAPVGVVDDRDTVFSTLHGGEAVATLTPIDTGDTGGGRWVIDGQSQPGLFAIAAGADGSATLVVANSGAIPAPGAAVTIDVHYYDRYQLDSGGNPIAGQGVAQNFSYTVQDGSSQDLAGFGPDLTIGAGAASGQASPALANLGDAGLAVVWQGQDQDGSSAVWAQLRDASGAARGAQFAIAAQAGVAEGEPAVAALANGRFAVAYTVTQDGLSHLGYRIVEANGAVGAQQFADGGAGDASMPALAALADGSLAIGWRSGGAIHTRQADGASGALLGAEHVTGALGSAFSPSIAPLHNGGYVVSWGEIADGNVYAALENGSGASAPMMVSGDGLAASVSTAAPLPHVAALAGGGFVVAWDSYSNDPRAFTISDVFFQRYDDAGNPLGAITQADVDSGTGRFDAGVAALSDGGFVITWQAQNGDYDGNGVFGRRFGADGSALDPHEFEINQQRQGDQASPEVTALHGGGFATAWVDTQAGAAGSSIELRVLAGAPDAGGASTGSGSSGALASVPVQLTGGAGSNSFAPVGSNAIDGGAGLDTVLYHGSRASFALAHDASGFTLADAAGSHHDSLVNVERVQFDDAMVALDINGTAGQAYRLYQAAFDRVPDAAGLGYWIKMMDGGASLEQVADGFVGSKEFADLYGANSTDAQFVGLLYQNVLHRAAEGAGYDYWMDSLGNHHVPREQVLGYFSESAENQAQVIGSIQDGITYHPWG
jgi:hypothetical protein